MFSYFFILIYNELKLDFTSFSYKLKCMQPFAYSLNSWYAARKSCIFHNEYDLIIQLYGNN